MFGEHEKVKEFRKFLARQLEPTAYYHRTVQVFNPDGNCAEFGFDPFELNVTTVALHTNDVVLVKFKNYTSLSQSSLTSTYENLKTVFPNNKVVILDSTVDIRIARGEKCTE